MKFSSLKELVSSLQISIRVTGDENEWEVEAGNGGATGESTEDEDDREELIYDEARTVLEYQVETLNDIDDKAARTVRITALLVGGVFGAVSFGNRSSLVVNQFTWWGSVSLLLAVVLGMTTYSQSSPFFGPKPSDWKKIRQEAESKRETKEILVREGYRGWIDANSSINQINSYFLLLTQWSIAVSLLLFGTGLSLEFADDKPFVPGFFSAFDFSCSLPIISFSLTPASTPVVIIFVLAVVTYVYSLGVKSRMT